ncbi:beta-1,4-N-acetylgalactosaminyltransferase 3 [Silurus meridionalis]|nr:beta-1,4-N-acetylgalactosaminyltransferase 3 [Silurus meridionalis]
MPLATSLAIFQSCNITGVPKSTRCAILRDMAKDDNSILLLCDLHIHFPPSILDQVRKHSILGKAVYAPIVMRLECGATVKAPTGFWETEGYGLLGIYKSDMVQVGGMNFNDYKEAWGGEDWELLDSQHHSQFLEYSRGTAFSHKDNEFHVREVHIQCNQCDTWSYK